MKDIINIMSLLIFCLGFSYAIAQKIHNRANDTSKNKEQSDKIE